jgi:hypothetical protein
LQADADLAEGARLFQHDMACRWQLDILSRANTKTYYLLGQTKTLQ